MAIAETSERQEQAKKKYYIAKGDHKHWKEYTNWLIFFSFKRFSSCFHLLKHVLLHGYCHSIAVFAAVLTKNIRHMWAKLCKGFRCVGGPIKWKHCLKPMKPIKYHVWFTDLRKLVSAAVLWLKQKAIKLRFTYEHYYLYTHKHIHTYIYQRQYIQSTKYNITYKMVE